MPSNATKMRSRAERIKKPKVKKPPMIRRGTTKPYVKSTQDEVQRRIEEAVMLLGQSATTGMVKAALIAKYGVNWQMALVYIDRAKKLMLSRANMSKEDVKAEALAFYDRMILSKSVKDSDKLKARQRKDEIFGIDAPKWNRSEISGPEGAPIPMITQTESKVIVVVRHAHELLNGPMPAEISSPPAEIAERVPESEPELLHDKGD
jgi:hypothetical protein